MIIFHQLFPGSEMARIAAQAGIDIRRVNLTSKNFMDLYTAVENAYASPEISTALAEKIQELERRESYNIYNDFLQKYPNQEERASELTRRIIEYRARIDDNIIRLIIEKNALSFPKDALLTNVESAQEAKETSMQKLGSYLLGNYAAQIIDIGLRSGLLRAIDAAGGISDDQLAKDLGFALIYVQWWCKAAYAFEVLEREGEVLEREGEVLEHERQNAPAVYRLAPNMKALLLDPDDLDFLGDEFLLSTALFQEFHDFPSYLYTGQIKPRSETDPRVRRFYQNLTQDDAFIITHLVLPLAQEGVLKQLQEAGSRILDIGTGAGDALIHYADCFPAAQVIGLDIDPPTVLLAQRKIAQEAPNKRIEVRLGDANQFEPEAPFDLITINLALHEMGVEYRQVLQRAFDFLKPGGAVVVCEFYAADGVAAYRNPAYQQWLSLHLHEILLGSIMIPSGQLQQLLAEVGFNAERVHALDHPINGYLMVLAEKEKQKGQ